MKKRIGLVSGLLLIMFLMIIVGCTKQVQDNSDNRISHNYEPKTRTYYIAAENVEWDYAPSVSSLKNHQSNKNAVSSEEVVWIEQTKYNKVRYVEYTDETFTVKKEQPEWLGIMGPILRGVVGDKIQVYFKNNAEQPYSIHPHGLWYDKDNEGVVYSGMSGDELGKGAKIMPGEEFIYVWGVPERAGPGKAEGSSKVWMYHSHVDSVSDIYQGLLGTIIITDPKYANEDATPNDIDKEFVNLFMIYNEAEEGMNKEEAEGHLKHSINGYIFGNLPGLKMNKGDKVRWHLIGMGTEVDLHTPHWHGETVDFYGKRTDVVELLPATMLSVDMNADNVGEWMYHCHVTDHITAGMMAMYTIN